MRKTRLEKEYGYHISWLCRYYKTKELAIMAEDKSVGQLERCKRLAWLRAIVKTEEQTRPELLKAVKAIYIFKTMTTARAGAVYLFYNEKKTRNLIRDYFKALDERFLEEVRRV